MSTFSDNGSEGAVPEPLITATAVETQASRSPDRNDILYMSDLTRHYEGFRT